MVKNDGVLPLAASPTGTDSAGTASAPKLAVIGHNARYARTQGGGSATVVPEKIVTPLDGIRAAFGAGNVSYSVGAVVQEGIGELPLEQLKNPVTGEPGVRVEFLGPDGNELFAEDRRSSALVWIGGDAPISASSWSGSHHPHAGGERHSPARLLHRWPWPDLRGRHAPARGHHRSHRHGPRRRVPGTAVPRPSRSPAPPGFHWTGGRTGPRGPRRCLSNALAVTIGLEADDSTRRP